MSYTNKSVAAVILAGGRSQRMGQHNKLLAEVNGKSMVRWAVEAAIFSKACSTIIVTGFEADKLTNELYNLACWNENNTSSIVHNSEYSTGMASSLRAGVQAAGDVDGVLIMLADMPYVSSVHINTLFDYFCQVDDSEIIVPVFDEKKVDEKKVDENKDSNECENVNQSKRANRHRGNPVLWPKCYFSELLTIKGDVGAKSLLKKYASCVKDVPLGSDAIHLDIDTLELLDGANSKKCS